MALHLIHKFAAAEDRFSESRFLAPRILGGQVQARVEGLVRAMHCTPEGFEGWGVFRPTGPATARLEGEATVAQSAAYLRLFPTLRLILVQPQQGRSWLALPANRSEAKQKFRLEGPQTVHLVVRGQAFEQVLARYDGSHFWFDRLDRGADPALPGFAARALRAFTPAEALARPGLTPEFREAYRMLFSPRPTPRPVVRCSEARLRQALEQGGGTLRSYVDQGDYWTTHWSTRDGEEHTSAIMKSDLTVLSAGICLDGEDQKFDLTSLVGVVENRE